MVTVVTVEDVTNSTAATHYDSTLHCTHYRCSTWYLLDVIRSDWMGAMGKGGGRMAQAVIVGVGEVGKRDWRWHEGSIWMTDTPLHSQWKKRWWRVQWRCGVRWRVQCLWVLDIGLDGITCDDEDWLHTWPGHWQLRWLSKISSLRTVSYVKPQVVSIDPDTRDWVNEGISSIFDCIQCCGG